MNTPEEKSVLPTILEANADGSLKGSPTTEPAPDALTLFPFEDGTVLKYVERAGFAGQSVLVNHRGDILAITRTESVAAMICDGVNVLFASLDKKQEIELAAQAQDIADSMKPKPPTPEEIAAQAMDPSTYSAACLEMLAKAEGLRITDPSGRAALAVSSAALYQAALAGSLHLIGGKNDLPKLEEYGALLQRAAVFFAQCKANYDSATIRTE